MPVLLFGDLMIRDLSSEHPHKVRLLYIKNIYLYLQYIYKNICVTTIVCAIVLHEFFIEIVARL